MYKMKRFTLALGALASPLRRRASGRSLARKPSKSTTAKGFTLIELITVTAMSSIVFGGLLYVLSTVVRANERERAETETQREMKLALEFIAEELREAVYIYNNEELVNRPIGTTNGVLDHLDPDDDLGTVILAFWKPEIVAAFPTNFDTTAECNNVFAGNNAGITECRQLLTRGRTYSLVVYLYDESAGGVWGDVPVIRRAVLRKYNSGAGMDLSGLGNDLPRNTGYIDPVENGVTFQTWPYAGNFNNQTEPFPIDNNPSGVNNAFVLVDSVDRSDTSGSLTNLLDCDNLDLFTDDDNNGIDDVEDYIRTPQDTNVNSFYTCVRQLDAGQGNQDTALYLRGNPAFKTSAVNLDSSPTPSVQTRVISRGVYQKQ